MHLSKNTVDEIGVAATDTLNIRAPSKIFSLKLSMFLILAIIAAVDSRGYPFNQASRKLISPFVSKLGRKLHSPAYTSCSFEEAPWINFSKKHRVAFLHHMLTVRGGDTIDDNDIAENEDDIPMSNVIASFESDLAEIRREAELEAENEMQKLRGLLEESQDVDNEDMPQEQNWQGDEDVYDERVEDEEDLLYDDNIDDVREENDEGQPSDEDADDISGEIQQQAIEPEDEDDVIQENEIEDEQYREENNEMEEEREVEESREINDAPVDGDEDVEQLEIHDNHDDSLTDSDKQPIDENDTEGEIQEDESSESESIMIDADNRELSDNEIVDTMDESSKITEEIQTDKEEKPKKSKKRGQPRVTKKTVASKSKKSKKRKLLDKNARNLDTNNIPRRNSISGQESVSVTLTQDKDIEQTRPSGIIGLLGSDLARASTLFIATIVVCLWTQRLQRQLEATGN